MVSLRGIDLAVTSIVRKNATEYVAWPIFVTLVPNGGLGEASEATRTNFGITSNF